MKWACPISLVPPSLYLLVVHLNDPLHGQAVMEIFGLHYAVTLMKAKTLFEGAKLGYLCWQFFVCPTLCGMHPLGLLVSVMG